MLQNALKQCLLFVIIKNLDMRIRKLHFITMIQDYSFLNWYILFYVERYQPTKTIHAVFTKFGRVGKKHTFFMERLDLNNKRIWWTRMGIMYFRQLVTFTRNLKMKMGFLTKCVLFVNKSQKSINFYIYWSLK
jgi:hypothetical protein